jgi:adenylate kinase family enzyme
MLIEDAFTIQIFKTYTTTLEPNHYMLIDGFPRKMHQMHAFFEYMLDNNRDFVAIFLDLDEEKAIQRLMLRGRSDDVPSAIRQRIDQYLAETMPVVNYFKSIDKLITVNGDNSVQQVWEEMIEKVHQNFK